MKKATRAAYAVAKKSKTRALRTRTAAPTTSVLKMKSPEAAAQAQITLRHRYGKHTFCKTDAIGHATPSGKSPLEIVVDASDGFIPLWAKGVSLRWRFQELALSRFENAEQIKGTVRRLLAKAITA